ncbi:MAG: ATP-binding protein [Gemmatimonadota bacterium]
MSDDPDTGRASEVVRSLLQEDVAEAYELGPAGYASTDSSGTIIKVNTTFLTWTGFARGDLQGSRRLQDLLSIAGRIYYETHLGPLLSMQGSLNEIAVDIVRKDGSTLPAILNASQKRAPSGEIVLNRFTIINATERRRYERQLLEERRTAERATRAKTELLETLSHDIRTPLGSVMIVASMLERTTLTAEQARAVRILKSSVSSMLALANDILDRGRLEAAGGPLVERPFDMRALVRDLVGNLEPLAREKEIALHVTTDARIPVSVLGDPTKLSQVLNNLLGNAVKFTERGEVTLNASVIRLTAGEVFVRVSVTDTGIGIAADALPHIFEEYRQADDAIAPRFGGTGLGLTISRRILQALGSDLHVRSTPGEGSEFRFDLPLHLP